MAKSKQNIPLYGSHTEIGEVVTVKHKGLAKYIYEFDTTVFVLAKEQVNNEKDGQYRLSDDKFVQATQGFRVECFGDNNAWEGAFIERLITQ